MPRVVGWLSGVGRFLMSHVPLQDIPGAAGRISLIFSRDAASSAAAALRVV